MFEKHPAFPAKTNTEFTEVVNRNYVKMHVWERGAGATLACGTGACAPSSRRCWRDARSESARWSCRRAA